MGDDQAVSGPTTTLSRWWQPGLVAVVGVVVLVVAGGVLGVVLGVALLAYALVVSPAFFPRSAQLSDAVRGAEAREAPLVLWKPGCLFCVRLRAATLFGRGSLRWVDSSLHRDAQELVRSHNGGDHTTPTVLFGDEVQTNPDVAWVRSTMR